MLTRTLQFSSIESLFILAMNQTAQRENQTAQ